MEVDSLFHRVVILCTQGRHRVDAAIIDDVHLLCPNAQGRARGVHGRVAAADDPHAGTWLHVGLVRTHETLLYQLHTTQEVGSLAHTYQIGAADGTLAF